MAKCTLHLRRTFGFGAKKHPHCPAMLLICISKEKENPLEHNNKKIQQKSQTYSIAAWLSRTKLQNMGNGQIAQEYDPYDSKTAAPKNGSCLYSFMGPLMFAGIFMTSNGLIGIILSLCHHDSCLDFFLQTVSNDTVGTSR